MEASSLKKINLDELQKPKTLILIHYKNKRISIPLFEGQPNITEYLYHQIEKFEVTVLQPQQEALAIKTKPKQTPLNIVCFSSHEQENQRSDLKINLVLSMMRLIHDHGRCRTDLRNLDITMYSKYMEIQPYYMPTQKQLIPEYQIHSILSSDKVFTNYLCRRIHDGRFFAVQIAPSSSKAAEKEYLVLKQLHEEQFHLEKHDLGAIPQIQEIRNTQGFIICVLEFCAGGTLSDCPKKVTEMQCLEYMKQLIWGVHTLHQKYNILHRHVCLDSIWIDFHGNLRIFNYRFCQVCYSSNYLISSEIAKAYEEEYELQDGTTPPEVRRSGNYNKLVDYYGIGMVLFQIFNGRKPNHEKTDKIKEREGIEIAIENLMSENLRDREIFVNEIITELHEEKKQLYSSRQSVEENEDYCLPLGRMKVGKSFILEDRAQNNILHEDVAKILKTTQDDHMFYLNPINKKSKSKKKKLKDHRSQNSSGILKKSFDSKSKKSSKSKVSQDKSMESKKSKNKSKSQKKTTKVQPKPPVRSVKSPPKTRTMKSPPKPKEGKTEQYISYYHKITHKH